MAAIPLCRYILQGGNQCTQAAVNGEYYCRHHLVVRRTVAATTPKPNPYRIEQPLPLIFPEDRAALQLDIFVVMQAFNEGQIGPKSANIFTRLLHECSINLKHGPLYETDRENAVRKIVITPEGEEIAPAREVSEENEGTSQEPGGEPTRNEPASGEMSSEKPAGNEAVSVEPASNEAASGEQPNKQVIPQVLQPPASSQYDLACNDPCYVANLTERREQYRVFALNDLAAGRAPRAWEDFIPGKSRMRKPKIRCAG